VGSLKVIDPSGSGTEKMGKYFVLVPHTFFLGRQIKLTNSLYLLTVHIVVVVYTGER
jgi:hypothetical protein